MTGVSVLAPVIEPTIDAQGLKEKLRDTTYGGALADLGEGIKVLTIDLSSMLRCVDGCRLDRWPMR